MNHQTLAIPKAFAFPHISRELPFSEDFNCKFCNAHVSAHAHVFDEPACDRCISFKRLRESGKGANAEKLREREIEFAAKCPTQYKINDVEKIERSVFEKVTSYRLSPRGLMCIGDSQKGKTTSCWRLLEILYVSHGHQFEAMTETEFAQNIPRKTREHGIDAWMDRLCRVPILFMDDIGHEGSGYRHLDDLLYIVEKRTSWKRPIIATTQFTRLEMQAKAKTGEKTVQAILNRLSRFCEVVTF